MNVEDLLYSSKYQIFTLNIYIKDSRMHTVVSSNPTIYNYKNPQVTIFVISFSKILTSINQHSS